MCWFVSRKAFALLALLHVSALMVTLPTCACHASCRTADDDCRAMSSMQGESNQGEMHGIHLPGFGTTQMDQACSNSPAPRVAPAAPPSAGDLDVAMAAVGLPCGETARTAYALASSPESHLGLRSCTRLYVLFGSFLS